MATAVVNGELASQWWRMKLPERLPALKGKWLTVYSVAWMALLAVALIGVVESTRARIEAGAGETYTWGPLGMYLADKGGIVRDVTGRVEENAGIHAGDAIVAADGAAVPADTSATSDQAMALDRQLERLPEGAAVRLTVRTSGGKLREVTVRKRLSNASELYASTGLTPYSVTVFWALAALFAPLTFCAAACILFGRRRDRVAALLSLSFVLFAVASSNVFWSELIGASAAHVASDIVGSLGGWGLMLVLLTFPEGRFEPKWTLVIGASVPFVDVIEDILPQSQLFAWLGRAIIVAALASMIIRYRRTSFEDRRQWRWALLGFLAGLGLLIAYQAAYSAYLAGHPGLSVDLWSWVVTPASMTTCILLIVGGVTLSVLRYRLYDTQAAVSRSAAYGVLTLGFVALFAGTEKLAEIIGERYFEHSIGIVAGAVGAAVAAAVVVPLHNRVHRWAERRFQKPLIRLREGLPECVSDLRESAPVEQLISAVMSRIEAGVRSTREAVLLADKGKLIIAGTRGVASNVVRQWQGSWPAPDGEQILECNRHDPTFPLRVRLCIETSGEPETIGWLLLGPRPDGSFFGRDEREALAHVAGPVARAIHIAQLREQREEHAERRISGLEMLIDRLVQSLKDGSPKSLVQPG